MQLPKLDKRLSAAYDLIGTCAHYADIGADHGLLPLHLVHDKRVAHAIVADISVSALKKAETAFQTHDLPAQFVVADGLQALDKRVDVISILGMGGETLCGILTSGKAALSGAALVVSPHTHLFETRECIMRLGYRITKERLVHERRRYYVLMRCEEGPASYDQSELLLGPCLLKQRPPLFSDYLLWRQAVTTKIPAAAWELELIKEARQCL